mgnify:FL=1
MPFTVLLTNGATKDLEELYEYITLHDVPGKADYVLTEIENAFSSLSESPDRGVYPKELLSLGIREFREIFFKPYRIIYSIRANNVYIMLIVDGRRDLQALLQRRILEA